MLKGTQKQKPDTIWNPQWPNKYYEKSNVTFTHGPYCINITKHSKKMKIKGVLGTLYFVLMPTF